MHLETLKIQHGEKKKATIFSIDISALGEIATGGGDGKITVWDTNQTFFQHSSAVLCVRFSPSGIFLASSSDDQTVNVYRREKSFSLVKRLGNHKSDVVGLAWTDELLITAGCDGIINFYGTRKFSLEKKIEEKLFLKGLAVDPSYKYLCVQYDKGIRLHDLKGQLVATNEDAFKGSVVESFFSRMSFSGDSKFVAAGLSFNNATNSVEILDMNLESIYSLIGHAAPSEIAVFNPSLFVKDEKYYVIAVASQDRSVSLWNSMNSRPFLLLKNVVNSPVLDMRWSVDGTILLMCTYDGEAKRLRFEKNELGMACCGIGSLDKLPLTYEYYELGKVTEQGCDACLDEKFPGDRGNLADAKELNIVNEKGEDAQKQKLTEFELKASKCTTVKKIKPVLIAPLDEADGVIRSKGGSELFIFRSTKRPVIAKEETGTFVKVVKEHRIEYNTKDSELRVLRGEKVYFSLHRPISHISVSKNYIALVCAETNADKLVLLDIETCNLVMPSFYSYGVATIDMMGPLLLVLEITGDFRIINVEKRRKVSSGVLPFEGDIKINFNKKYFFSC